MSAASPSTRKNHDCFSIQLSELRPDATVTFDVFLYLPANDHLVLLRSRQQLLERQVIQSYQTKGLKSLWIKNSDRAAYEQYIKSPLVSPQTREGELVGRALTSTMISETSKRKVAAEVGTQAIMDASKPTTHAEQAVLLQKQKAIVQDILQHAGRPEHKDLLQEMLEMSRVDPNLEHSVNVSMYTVLFSLAFGHIDPKLLSDLAMSGLLHDFGLTKIAWDDTRSPWSKQDPPTQKRYARHVELGIEVLQSLPLAESLSPKNYPRIFELIRQSHEKFDGTGYPKQLKGFDFDDLAQILALAELVDSIASGQWDGERRSFKESFKIVETWENESNFPKFFNPDIFQLIQHWVHSEHSQSSLKEATNNDVLQLIESDQSDKLTKPQAA